MTEKNNPRSSEQALAESIGLNALHKIGRQGLQALAVDVPQGGTYDLIVVPDHPATLNDILDWEDATGDLRVLFQGEADIKLCVMSHDEFHAFRRATEPNYNSDLAEA